MPRKKSRTNVKTIPKPGISIPNLLRMGADNSSNEINKNSKRK
jgi:hypothetical protein